MSVPLRVCYAITVAAVCYAKERYRPYSLYAYHCMSFLRPLNPTCGVDETHQHKAVIFINDCEFNSANKYEAVNYVWKPLEECLRLYPKLYNEMARLYPKRYSTFHTRPTRDWYDESSGDMTTHQAHNSVDKESGGSVRIMKINYYTTTTADPTAKDEDVEIDDEEEEAAALADFPEEKKVMSAGIVLEDSDEETDSTESKKLATMNMTVTEGPMGHKGAGEPEESVYSSSIGIVAYSSEQSPGGFVNATNLTTQTATAVVEYASSEEAVKHANESKPHDWKAEQGNSKEKDQTPNSSDIMFDYDEHVSVTETLSVATHSNTSTRTCTSNKVCSIPDISDGNRSVDYFSSESEGSLMIDDTLATVATKETEVSSRNRTSAKSNTKYLEESVNDVLTSVERRQKSTMKLKFKKPNVRLGDEEEKGLHGKNRKEEKNISSTAIATENIESVQNAFRSVKKGGSANQENKWFQLFL